MFSALGLRSHLKDSLHLQSEIHPGLPGTLIRTGLGHFKEIEKRFGDFLSEDIIVGLPWNSKVVKGQRFSGHLEDYFFLH